MKNSRRLYLVILFPAFLLCVCESLPGRARRPRPAAETVKELPEKFHENSPSLAELSSPVETTPPSLNRRFEQAVEKIKRNGKDIDKYFVTDKEGRIVVKAGLRDANGNFEIVYDLENARELGNEAYEVGFSCLDKESGMLLKDALVWNPSAKAAASNAGLLLSFDDYYTDAWERYFDLFDKYKARITFFIIGKPDAAGVKTFCAKALNRGHDIGYHGLSHPDLRKMSRNEFNAETAGPVKAFREAGIPVSSFAYPYGFYEPWMHDALLGSFGVLRGYGTTFRLYNEAEIKRGYIVSRAIDNTVVPPDGDFYRIVNIMLRTVKFIDKNLVLPLTTHDISASAAWGISPGRLEYLLKTANELGLVFYRYCDFAL